MRSQLERVTSRMADEHREVMRLVSRLESIDSSFDAVSFLEELHNVLINHFAHEQFPGGLYECMGAYGSSHHEELCELIRQHCDILSCVGGLLERAKNTTSADREGLLSDIEAAVESLDAHERREHRLASALLSVEPDTQPQFG